MDSEPKPLFSMALFVKDKDRAKAFYEKAFGLKPLFEDSGGVVLRLANTYLFLATMDETQSRVAPATVGTSNGPRQIFAIQVDDVDAVCRELTTKGIALLNGPEDRSWGMRTANIQDPDGYVWEIATDLDPSGQA